MTSQADGVAPRHASSGTLSGDLGVDSLVVVGTGDGSDALTAAASEAGVSVHHVPDRQAAIDLLQGSLRPADLVLVKASSEAGMSAVAAALTNPVTRSRIA